MVVIVCLGWAWELWLCSDGLILTVLTHHHRQLLHRRIVPSNPVHSTLHSPATQQDKSYCQINLYKTYILMLWPTEIKQSTFINSNPPKQLDTVLSLSLLISHLPSLQTTSNLSRLKKTNIIFWNFADSIK